MINEELKHHGILGMKWGIRRYQNKDGSLTSSGKRRQKILSKDASEVEQLRKKKIGELSNSEIEKINRRLNLERQYSNLNPNTLKKAIAVVGVASSTMGNIAGIYKTGNKLVKVGKPIVQKAMKNLKK